MILSQGYEPAAIEGVPSMFNRILAGVSLGLIGLWLVSAAPTSAWAQSNPINELAEAWARSPHARIEAEAFVHWDAEGEVPTDCATCHSGRGFMDFIGADGSTAGQIDHPAPFRSVIDCATCHNDAADQLASVTFPSGVIVNDLGSSARCMVCHQGRESTVDVNKATASLEDDAVSADLGFLNIHYRAAAATLFGSQVKGAYEYDGKEYLGKFAHVEAFDTCVECHNPHSAEVRVEACAGCHQDTPLEQIRMAPVDFDGDADVKEGVSGEIASMHAALLQSIMDYAANVAGTAIFYDEHTYPYFFVDSNGNGVGDADEAAFPNRYQSWTPRLLRAAYNYQFAAKDTGAYAHNPRYVMQILYDSMDNLSQKTPVEMSAMTRP
jgi:hypothetical protein